MVGERRLSHAQRFNEFFQKHLTWMSRDTIIW